MLNYLRPRDLDPVAALAAAAIIIFAIFAWTVNTDLADPNDLSVAGWGWKLWQIGPLVMGFAGAWWFWLSTRRASWVRSLALAVLALMVFINGYTGLFGDYRGRRVAHRQPVVHRLVQRGRGGAVAVRLHGRQGGSSVAGYPGGRSLRQRLLRQQRSPVDDPGPGADAR